MALTFVDRARQTTTTTGTGTLTLGGAVAGFRTLAQAITDGDLTDGDVVPYRIADADGTAWEQGFGTYTNGGTALARNVVTASTNSGSAINLSAGTHTAEVCYHAEAAMSYPTQMPGGRLTLTSGTPVTTSDVTGASTIYYTPYVHDRIMLWDGYSWRSVKLSETSLALSGLAAHAAYDVFGYLSSGSLVLEKLEWLNATATFTNATDVVNWTAHGMSNGDAITLTNSGGALPTGLSADTPYYVINANANDFQIAAELSGSAVTFTTDGTGTTTAHCFTKRGTDIALTDGRYTKSGDKTRLLLGGFRATAATTTEDSAAFRRLSNMYNDVGKMLSKYDSTASWTYTTTTHRPWNNSTANRVDFFTCVTRQVAATFTAITSNTSAVDTIASIGIDNISTPGTTPTGATSKYGQVRNVAGGYSFSSPSARGGLLGGHFFQCLEQSTATGTTTWYGGQARGIIGEVSC